MPGVWVLLPTAHWRREASAVPQEVPDHLKATGRQEELHTAMVLSDRTAGLGCKENSELGVGPLAISDGVRVYALSLPRAPHILGYISLHGGLSSLEMWLIVHLTALRPPQRFCVERARSLSTQAFGGS